MVVDVSAVVDAVAVVVTAAVAVVVTAAVAVVVTAAVAVVVAVAAVMVFSLFCSSVVAPAAKRYGRLRCLFLLLGFCGSFCGLSWWFDSTAFLAARFCRVFCAAAMLTCGKMCVIVPTAFVRPSRKTMRMSFFRYSGFLMNRKRTVALSPVRRCSLVMHMIVAVWRTLPT